jgi:CBS-domain-containing membrane protein
VLRLLRLRRLGRHANRQKIKSPKKIGPGKRGVTILPDSLRNDLTMFVDAAWKRANGFNQSRWESAIAGEALRSLPRRKLLTARASDSLADAVMQMKASGISQLPVVDDNRLDGPGRLPDPRRRPRPTRSPRQQLTPIHRSPTSSGAT